VARYRIVLASSAEKELNGLSAQLNARIVPRLEKLADNPRPPGCKKLKGGDKECAFVWVAIGWCTPSTTRICWSR